MALTSEEIGGSARSLHLPRSATMLAYSVTFGLVAVAIYVLVGALVSWGQVRLDDLRYGRPRTTHLEVMLGHRAEATGQSTRVIGLNLDRQVVVLVLPGGDPAQIYSLPGPYLFGATEDLVPVVLSLQDIDGDTRPDLLMNVRNEQIIYLNREGTFRLPTPEEQQGMIEERGL